MADLVMLLVTAVFFVLSFGLVIWFDRI